MAENTVTNDLPYNNADWSHYGGKVRDLQTGGFRIDLTGNSTGTDFFMACWIKFDTYSISRQMGIDLFGGYVYWETLANGAIAVRHMVVTEQTVVPQVLMMATGTHCFVESW